MRLFLLPSMAAVAISLVFMDSAAHSRQPRKVLFYMLDGLASNGTFGFESLLANGDIPAFQSLVDGTWESAYHGAYDPASISGGVVGTETEQITLTHVSWTTVFTGVFANLHENTADFNNTPANFEDYPPITQTLRDELGSSIRMTTHARGFFTFNINPNHQTLFDKVSLQSSTHLDASLADQTYAADDELILYYENNIDFVGHFGELGGGTDDPNYGDAIEQVDNELSASLATIRSRPNFDNEDWTIIVASDHGHTPHGTHGLQSLDEKETPLIVASKSTTQRTLSGTTIASFAPTILNFFDVDRPSHYVEGPIVLSDGDYDHDGDTDGNDLLAWQRSVGSRTALDADGSYNGVVDAADIAIWQAGYSTSALAGASVTRVPEPTSLAICMTLTVSICARLPKKIAQQH